VEHSGQFVATICLQDADDDTWNELGDAEVMAGYVHGLAIRAHVRRMGIGHSLLSFAERSFREQGKRFVRLDCVADNDVLTKYYLQNGYREVRLRRTRLFEKAL
jgi:ribosomal protein S18 acetylase RimI-like enzyme